MTLALQIFPLVCLITYLFQKLFYARKYKDGRVLVKRIKSMLYWSVLFRGMIITFFATALWLFVYFKNWDVQAVVREDFQTTLGFRRMLVSIQEKYPGIQQEEDLGSALVSYFKIFAMSTFSLGSLYFLSRNIDILDAKKIQIKYQTLWHNQTTKKRTAFAFMLLFIFRRMTLAFLTVWFNDYVFAAVYFNFYISIYLVGYGVWTRPLTERWINILENLNEGFIVLSGYFVLMFSEWVGDVYVRYEYGSVFVDLLQGIVLVNVGMIGNDMINAAQMHYRKRIYEIKCANAIRYKQSRIEVLLKESNVTLPEEVLINKNLLMLHHITKIENKIRDLQI